MGRPSRTQACASSHSTGRSFSRRRAKAQAVSIREGSFQKRARFQGLRSLLRVGSSGRSNWPVRGSACHCITGQKHPMAVARRYSSLSGRGPAKPPMSKLQNRMPDSPADNPAVSCPRSSSQVLSWSPAQWMGARCEPA